MDPLKMYFLLKLGIFHCYVSLPEGSTLQFRDISNLGTTILPTPKKTWNIDGRLQFKKENTRIRHIRHFHICMHFQACMTYIIYIYEYDTWMTCFKALMDQVSEFRLSYLATSFTATGSLENSQAHSYVCLFSDGIFWVFFTKTTWISWAKKKKKFPPPRCRNDVPFRFHHVLLLAPWRTQRTGCFFCFFWEGRMVFGQFITTSAEVTPKR